MSSYIVNQQCMRNIIDGLFLNNQFRLYYGNTLKKAGYDYTAKDFERLGNDLYALNTLAVSTRYDEAIDPTIFEWGESKLNINQFQVLKSMECLQYQCSQDKIYDTPLFQLLKELIGAWQSLIISSMAEYQKAVWDSY